MSYKEKSKQKKVISIDLDGVLNEYRGDYKENELAPIKDGAYEFLEKLSVDYQIEIYTVRNINLCRKWLEDNNLMPFISDIRDTKSPFTSVFIDDRALCFEGNFHNTYEKIINFKPYWK